MLFKKFSICRSLAYEDRREQFRCSQINNEGNPVNITLLIKVLFKSFLNFFCMILEFSLSSSLFEFLSWCCCLSLFIIFITYILLSIKRKVLKPGQAKYDYSQVSCYKVIAESDRYFWA